MLDEMLQYHELPDSPEFVAAVMRAVERQQRKRRRILQLCGLIGALFGAFGAWQLSWGLAEPLAGLSEQWLMALETQWLVGSSALPSGVVLLAFVGLLGWLLIEEFLPAS